ncbi:hypothetical protein FHS82_001174 [Pseudochelatococcus lubricantis]|uniref:DUF6894 domain-containing protein n=1 Tax=Pseudochelatococcus lubricantis TaxID=1538102 RepID=A0ABX0UWP0_9HYPH|nr:hypothetical protein [Pseudochelatococcus lubricantis]NIJ57348.1 hypothetical protein [Pseudochelatococcus lubricantis]
MFDNYLIEISGKPAGIIARDANGYRFHASENAFNDLDGRIFADPQAAERAARKLIARRRADAGPRGNHRAGSESDYIPA